MMICRIFIFLLLLICSCVRSYSSVFVVTSNADSGPGTFRDALTQAAANGSATTDYINFNIADTNATGRTITVLSQLPDISSNIVIDGSSQPGSPFGVSNAKVAFLFDATGQKNFSALKIINQTDVAIYSLYLKLVSVFKYPDKTNPVFPIGIRILGTNNVQLGDAGKGNVISGFFNPVSENDDQISESTGLIVKGNLIGIQSDGLTAGNDYYTTFTNVYGNLTIGGATLAEGNLFSRGVEVRWVSTTKFASVLIKNNKAGVNYNLTGKIGDANGSYSSYSIQVGAGLGKFTTNTVVNIEDNILGGNGYYNIGIFVSFLGGTVNMVRNYINVDKNQNQIGIASTTRWGIYVQYCKEVHIGTSDIKDANYIGYCTPIFYESSVPSDFTNYLLTFTKNSFFCSTGNLVYPGADVALPTQCTITKITTNSLLGTATPNATVDLYYSDKCNTCAPQYYFASVVADVNGNWAYNGPISGIVIANATYNNSSSEFTEPELISDNLIITNACGGRGSITGLVVHNVTSTKWLDETGNVAGANIDLLNIKGGKYRLVISNGGCTDTSDYYNVLPKFELDTTKALITQPACADSAGSITGLDVINSDNGVINYTWTDAAGKAWANTLALTNVPAGTYFLVATGKDTCVQTYGPIVLQDQNKTIPSPSVNNLVLCSTGEALLRVNNPAAIYSYRLYDSETGTTPLDEQKNGVFKITATVSKIYYVSEVFYSCESPRTKVTVDVGLIKAFIANAFTPNGDGINDYWNINGIENYPAAIIQIFTRFGQKVFESKGYTHPFDGTFNGKQLPVGVYYYIINFSTNCNFLSGSLTIIR